MHGLYSLFFHGGQSGYDKVVVLEMHTVRARKVTNGKPLLLKNRMDFEMFKGYHSLCRGLKDE